MNSSKKNQPKETKLIRPDRIYTIMDQYMEPTDNYSYHIFRGILNSDGHKNYRFCYVISFLQLLFHCDDVIKYLRLPNKKNQTEKYLSEMINKLYDNNNNYYIKIETFLHSWRGWNGNKTLPKYNEDSSEFCQFLLNKVTKKLYNLFKIKIDYKGQNPFDKNTTYHRTYFLRCVIRNDNVQDIVNQTIMSLPQIVRLPKYLLLCMQRNEGFGIVEDYVDINRFITINGQNYVFKGSTLFKGDENQGHYTTIMRISNKYILFNDDRVLPLFFYPQNYHKTHEKITKYNNRLHQRCFFLLYETYNGVIDITQFENIKATPELPLLQNPQTNQDKMTNTLNLIDKMRKTNDSTESSSSDICLLNELNQQESDDNNQSSTSINNNYKQQNSTIVNSESSDESSTVFSFTSDQNEIDEQSVDHLALYSNQISQKTSLKSSDIDDKVNSQSVNSSNESQCIDSNKKRPKSQPRHTNINKSNRSKMQSISSRSSPLHFICCQKCESLPHLEDSSSLDSSDMSTSDQENDQSYDQNVAKFKHINLLRKVVDVENLKAPDLKGSIKISESGSQYIPKKRQKESQFVIYRYLFKYAGRVLRELDYSDQGDINSELVQNKVGASNTPSFIIKEKGEEVFNIFCNLIKQGNFNFDDVKTALKPIVDWYKKIYGKEKVPTLTENVIIEDDLELSFPFDQILPKAENFKNAQSGELLDKLLDELHSSDSDDNDFDYSFSESEDDESTNEPEINDPEIAREEKKETDIESHESEDDESTNESEISDSEIACEEKNETASRSHMSSVFRFLNQNYTYEQLLEDRENDEDNYELEDDDNQFSLLCYHWNERAELLNVDEILENILYQIMHPIKDKKKEEKPSLSEIRVHILRDLILDFIANPINKNNISEFVRNYIQKNSNEETATSLVKQYKTLKKQPYSKPVYKFSTLRNHCAKYLSLSIQDKVTYLNAINNPKKWGGRRYECFKVTQDTLRCLITLVLDFPTMSPESFAAYINSPFGPNSAKEKHITGRTVQRYLRYLKFTCKKCSFAPPNRNSIGLRIFRVAWCKMMKRIAQQKNVLLGFIDEAGVSNCNGKNHGRGYLGVSPLVNCPLQKNRTNIVAVVFPGFGVVYRFVNRSMNGERYAEFIKDATNFARKYICCNKVEIVLIEDNCPIHGTKEVDDMVEHLKIALIPIVQYSPSLNEVVESYFGLVKAQSTIIITYDDLTNIELEIEKRWKHNSDKAFSVQKGEKLYLEWIGRLNSCINGEPLLSQHLDPKYMEKINTQHLINVDVNRISHLAVFDPRIIDQHK